MFENLVFFMAIACGGILIGMPIGAWAERRQARQDMEQARRWRDRIGDRR